MNIKGNEYIKTKQQLAFGLLVILWLDPISGFSQDFKQVYIEIEQDSINELEKHPYTNADVHGNFISEGQRIDNVEIHYRGAFYLYTLMKEGNLRNWKIKTAKANRYSNRREWNFNYELHLRQRMAYFLMDVAGVPCVSAQHVVFHVNGTRQGIYLQYEDPDNKKWLTETFGNNDGDLFKAAYDMPNETKYFADLTYLGDASEDYFLHYRKQTNNKGEDEYDYTAIKAFTSLINDTPENEFEKVIHQNFDVSGFLKYLVIANFMAHWDGYPFRPKNYFLYSNPKDSKWHFIPWDMDATFQDYGYFNSIRTTGSIFHYFDGYEPYNKTNGEPIDRPLVWNLMKNITTRDQYILEYKKAMGSYLKEDYLNNILDSLWLGIRDNGTPPEKNKFFNDTKAMRDFIKKRSQNVHNELKDYNVNTSTDDPFADHRGINNLIVYPNPSKGLVHVAYQSTHEIGKISMYNMNGKELMQRKVVDKDVYSSFDLSQLTNGNYLLVIENGHTKETRLITKQ